MNTLSKSVHCPPERDEARKPSAETGRSSPNDPGQVKLYFINLDASTGRREHMEAELARCGLPFERVPGVRGDALPADLAPYFDGAEGNLTPGEIGCHAAHLAACRQFLSNCKAGLAQVAVVLEDDVCLPDGFAVLLVDLLAALPTAWDIVRLSNTPKWACRTIARLGLYRLVQYSRVPNYTGAYLLSAAGARKLLRPGRRIHAIDNYLRRPWLADLDTYGLVPPPVSLIDRFPSDIDAAQDRVALTASLRHHWRRLALQGLTARLRYQFRFLGWRSSAWLLLMNVLQIRRTSD